ncbi:hypothetical protein F4823DRAFT_566106 [Ustulina deusta]|nr:hypothetical protein F4823DRAFT_566106 [Ustulina deusta]
MDKKRTQTGHKSKGQGRGTSNPSASSSRGDKKLQLRSKPLSAFHVGDFAGSYSTTPEELAFTQRSDSAETHVLPPIRSQFPQYFPGTITFGVPRVDEHTQASPIYNPSAQWIRDPLSYKPVPG